MSCVYRVNQSNATNLWFIERDTPPASDQLLGPGERLFGSWKDWWAVTVEELSAHYDFRERNWVNRSGIAAFVVREQAEMVAQRLAVLDA